MSYAYVKIPGTLLLKSYKLSLPLNTMTCIFSKFSHETWLANCHYLMAKKFFIKEPLKNDDFISRLWYVQLEMKICIFQIWLWSPIENGYRLTDDSTHKFSDMIGEISFLKMQSIFITISLSVKIIQTVGKKKQSIWLQLVF